MRGASFVPQTQLQGAFAFAGFLDRGSTVSVIPVKRRPRIPDSDFGRRERPRIPAGPRLTAVAILVLGAAILVIDPDRDRERAVVDRVVEPWKRARARDRHDAESGPPPDGNGSPPNGGSEIAARVLAIHPRSKVLFTSGDTDDGIVRRGLMERGSAFLEKPFTPDVLARKVRDVLDG